MADELVGTAFQIFSVEGHQPIGVNLTKPAFQVVYAGAPVNEWRIERDEEGTYRLSVGGYRFVGVNENHEVVASIYPDEPGKELRWRIVRSREREGFVIERVTGIWPQSVWVTSGEGNPVRVRVSEFPGLVPNELFLLKRSE